MIIKKNGSIWKKILVLLLVCIQGVLPACSKSIPAWGGITKSDSGLIQYEAQGMQWGASPESIERKFGKPSDTKLDDDAGEYTMVYQLTEFVREFIFVQEQLIIVQDVISIPEGTEAAMEKFLHLFEVSTEKYGPVWRLNKAAANRLMDIDPARLRNTQNNIAALDSATFYRALWVQKENIMSIFVGHDIENQAEDTEDEEEQGGEDGLFNPLPEQKEAQQDNYAIIISYQTPGDYWKLNEKAQEAREKMSEDIPGFMIDFSLGTTKEQMKRQLNFCEQYPAAFEYQTSLFTMTGAKQYSQYFFQSNKLIGISMTEIMGERSAWEWYEEKARMITEQLGNPTYFGIRKNDVYTEEALIKKDVAVDQAFEKLKTNDSFVIDRKTPYGYIGLQVEKGDNQYSCSIYIDKVMGEYELKISNNKFSGAYYPIAYY